MWNEFGDRSSSVDYHDRFTTGGPLDELAQPCLQRSHANPDHGGLVLAD
jgi:hypothetical protein